jgi:rod shape-determining protein MreC
MEYGPPPLFNQGVPARARLAFFSLLAIALIVVDSRIRVLETVRVGVGVVLYPVQQALLLPRAAVDRVGEYFSSINSLTRENAALKRAAVERAQVVQQAQHLAEENAQLRRLLGARERTGAAAVLVEALYESRDRFTRKLVLNKGATDGLRDGMPVIDEAGVVGQITRVFPLTAEVTLLTDKGQSIPVQILRNGLRGIAFGGAEPGTLDLRFMALNADIVNGDVAVTSGLDGVYPPGLAVATVTRVERNAKEQFARVLMTPAAGVESRTLLLALRIDEARVPAPPPEDGRAARPSTADRAAKPGKAGKR